MGRYITKNLGLRTNTPVTRRFVNAVKPPRPKQTDCSVTFIILCVAITRHDFCVTSSRLIEGTAARPSYDCPTNCATDPRLAHDRHRIIILIHNRRTTPSRRFQDSCVTLRVLYIKTRLRLVGRCPSSSSPSSSTDPNACTIITIHAMIRPSSARMMDLGIPSGPRDHS